MVVAISSASVASVMKTKTKSRKVSCMIDFVTLKRLTVVPALDAGLMDQMGAHVDEYVQLSKK